MFHVEQRERKMYLELWQIALLIASFYGYGALIKEKAFKKGWNAHKKSRHIFND